MSARSAYAALLDLSGEQDEAGRAVCDILPGEAALGRPGIMHGGAVASLMVQAGHATLAEALDGAVAQPSLISMTVEYLRAAPMQRLRARGEIVRLGGRAANLIVRVWAEDPAKPVAQAQLSFLVRR